MFGYGTMFPIVKMHYGFCDVGKGEGIEFAVSKSLCPWKMHKTPTMYKNKKPTCVCLSVTFYHDDYNL